MMQEEFEEQTFDKGVVATIGSREPNESDLSKASCACNHVNHNNQTFGPCLP